MRALYVAILFVGGVLLGRASLADLGQEAVLGSSLDNSKNYLKTPAFDRNHERRPANASADYSYFQFGNSTSNCGIADKKVDVSRFDPGMVYPLSKTTHRTNRRQPVYSIDNSVDPYRRYISF